MAPARYCGTPVPERLRDTAGTIAGMAFRGFPPAALAFFEGLEADNSKAWWNEHKAIYDEAVRGPMEELLASVDARFRPMRIFRPYLLLLACPVMHLFHGHARHHAKGGKRDDPGPHGG